MKKETMYNRIQKQYGKLNQRIQKALETGRFQAYTQFKQDQLLSRLKRCSFQLKQLGAGVAVVAALGLATPVVGQSYNLVERIGAANPLRALYDRIGTVFVDIDGDGDLDLFSTGHDYSGTITVFVEYYENTGTATAPDYVLRPAANNPLNSFSSEMYDLTFVDIDGDGDLDAFATSSTYVGSTFTYYENTGSSTNPVFAAIIGADNPLDSVNNHVSNLALGATNLVAAHPSFVDIDNDGDQDCFIGVEPKISWSVTTDVADKLWYYENTGTSTAPVFQKSTNANNPLGNIMSDSLINSGDRVQWGVQFLDGDTDGDQDAIINIEYVHHYLKNEGTPSAPMLQIASNPTPLDRITSANLFTVHVNYVDIDGDSDYDAVLRDDRRLGFRYYENTTPLGIMELNEAPEAIVLYPNPTNGNITLGREVTGELNVFNTTGQKVYTRELELTRTVNLSSLEAGTYLLRIQEGDKHLQQTIVIQK